MVSGRQAADAAHLLESAMPSSEEEVVAAGCGGGCCSADGECDPSVDEWPEDGDWWQTVPGEDEIKS